MRLRCAFGLSLALAFSLIFATTGPASARSVTPGNDCFAAQPGARSAASANVDLMDTVYHASGSAMTTTTVGTTRVGTSVVVASGSTFAVGQGIFIAGAGANGANYVGTISAINGTTLTISPATSTAVEAGHKVQHDDTAAVKAAIAAGLALDVATVLLPPTGFFRINGPLSGPGGHQYRIGLVNSSLSPNLLQSLTIKGTANPPQFSQTPNVTATYTTSGTVFTSEESGGSIFGGSTGGGITGVLSSFENFHIILPDNPASGGIDGFWLSHMIVRNVSIDTGENTKLITQPTHGTTGIITPNVGNGAHTIIENCFVQGLHVGLDINEHTVGVGHNSFSACNIALQFEGPPSHASHFQRILVINSPTVIKVLGGVFDIDQLDIEHADHTSTGLPAWQDPVLDIDDASNLGHGHVNYLVVKANVGPVHTFLNSGFYIWVRDLWRVDGTQDGPYVRIGVSGDMAVGNAVLTSLNWDTNVTSNDFGNALHSTSVNQHQFNCIKAGMAEITFSGEFEPNASGIRQARVYKNNGNELVQKVSVPGLGGGNPTPVSIMTLAPCGAPGDFFYIQLYQDSGGPLIFKAQTNLPTARFRITQ